MEDSSNTSVGSQSTESQTSTSSNESTTNSTGNFSGGLPGLGGDSWGSFGPSSETEAAHASGVQGPGLASGDFGTSWSGNGNSGSGSGDYTYNNTTYSNSSNKSEPVMTVDEVYGKGNQSIVESQGDYNAASNEKSNVETSTFGKQDTVTVTPQSIVEDKGLVNNNVIDSIEGLNFQQKDKESQDVLEAKKNRDEAEAEDKANQMRESLKAKADTTDENAINKFQIGDRNEDVAAAQAKAEEAEKAYRDLQLQVDDRQAELNAAADRLTDANAAYRAANANMPTDVDPDDVKRGSTVTLSGGQEITQTMYTGSDPNIKAAYDARNEAIRNLVEADLKLGDAKAVWDNYLNSYNESKAAAEEAKAAYDDIVKNTFVGAPAETSSNAETSIQAAREALESSTLSPEQKAQAEQSLADIETSRTSLEEAASKLSSNLENANPADIEAYVAAQKQYEDNLKEALDGNPFTKTDFNKSFVESIAKANDFTVTLADGTKTTYSQFAADMATKSPEIAQAMYNAKADRLEAEGHNVLAKIERAKSEMVGTWLGSKLTQADNQVRNQFNQMAKTNMRATYAAYNNVLSDPTASTEQKSEASAAINQANMLMTASTALQATTGFLSGIGDSMKDGVYGTTDPAALNAYQKTLNAVDNFAKITLGLGVTPGANRAYQNMYYMAGAKVNESGLFSRDFDSDGFALCQEYGNNAAAGMIAGAGELATGVALFFNPSTAGMGLNLVIDSIQTFTNGLYGVQKDARKAEKYTSEVVSYFNEAKDIAEQSGNKEAVKSISDAITQIENFELKSDEVGNLDNWLEGSGSNTATNEKFNQSLSYDEWLKLIEADPTMRDYAKKLIAEKKEK